MAARKRKPWNANLRMPGLGGEPLTGPPKPMVQAPVEGLSTGHMVPERWHIERVYADGRRELVTVGGQPWEGSRVKAEARAHVMGTEEPGVKFQVTQAPR